jgi:hypothetical protein
MVSATGFHKTAREKAAKRAITCMELSEVERFDWMAMEAFVGYERQFGDIHAQVMFVDAMPDEIAVVIDSEGKELSHEMVLQVVVNSVPAAKDPEHEVGKVFPVRMHINTPGWTARDGKGEIWAIDHILAETSFTMKKTVSEVQTHRYKGGGKDYAIASAAVKIGEASGRFVMVRNEDDTTDVYWTPDRHESGSAKP